MRGHKTALTYHARMLADGARMDAYERAIRRLVRPGDVVLNLGAGTGILAMLAARRGAARVHAVESMPVAHLAAELVAHNGLSDRVIVHHADAVQFAPVEPVDLVVSDFLGCFLVDDGMLPAVQAAGRWLKPGARFCPAAVRLQVAPAGGFALPAVDVFGDSFYGVDVAPATAYALRVCQLANLAPPTLLASPQRYADYTPPAALDALDRTLHFRLESGGELRGLAGWFDAELAPDVTLSTAPGIETHWGQHLFPLPPADARAGDELTVRLWLPGFADDDGWRWQGALTRDGTTVMAFDLEEETWVGQRAAVSRG